MYVRRQKCLITIKIVSSSKSNLWFLLIQFFIYSKNHESVNIYYLTSFSDICLDKMYIVQQEHCAYTDPHFPGIKYTCIIDIPNL
jgi:hypothetical protein